MEQAMLMEVKNDGQTLVLIDGRDLGVDPREIPRAILWPPSMLLEISETDTDPLFDHGTNNPIRISWT
jgi:hypothetical protein